MVLLAPHLQSTLSINDHAVHSLIAPGGRSPRWITSTRGALR